MFYTMLAMKVRYSDLLQKMSCGDIIDWQSHCGILQGHTSPGCLEPVIGHSKGARAGQFCWMWNSSDGQARTVRLSEVLPLKSSFHFFFSFSQMSALHHSLKVPWPTPAPSLFILQRHFLRVAPVHLILH